MTLKELLTHDPTSDGTPLFLTTAALSKAIITQKKSDYSNERSVSTLLGFIFCGKRSCPKTLREMILKAICERLSKESPSTQQEWSERIKYAIDLLNQEITKNNEARSERDEDQFDALLEHAELAEKHFVITSSPSVQETGIQRADKLSKNLLRLLGIYPKNEATPKTEYWFLLPNHKIGELFWEKLYEKATLLFPQDERSWIVKRIKFLEEHNYLQIYIVPSFVCGCSIVIYNPDYTRNSAAFSFSHHPNNVIDMIRWDSISIAQWKKNVFSKFYWQDPETKTPFVNEAAAASFMKNNPEFFAGYRCSPSFATS